jgi:hypothetical protein
MIRLATLLPWLGAAGLDLDPEAVFFIMSYP